MKFSERIKQNYGTSAAKNVIAIIIAGWFLLGFAALVAAVFAETGISMLNAFSFAEMVAAPMVAFVFRGLMGICIWVIISSVRKIKQGSLEEYMKTLTPYGDPRMLINYADGLRDRGLGDVDLRFDDRYLAFAHGRTILIRSMDQIRYLWDYGVETRMNRRRVCVLFKNGEHLFFSIKHTPHADTVLREFHDRSAFGKWIRSDDLKRDYAPFVHKEPRAKGNNLESDGKSLMLTDRKTTKRVSFEDLKSCYMYVITDSDSDDDYYMILYFADGSSHTLQVADDRDGFSLYLKMLNCAPHLHYQYPIR